jgi:hypothetical protein
MPAGFNYKQEAANRAAAKAQYAKGQNPPGVSPNIKLPFDAEFIYSMNPDGTIVGPVISDYTRMPYWTDGEIEQWLDIESRSRAEGRRHRSIFKMVPDNAGWKYEEIPVPKQKSFWNTCTGIFCPRRGTRGGKRTRRFTGKSKRTRKLKRTNKLTSLSTA